MQRSSGLQPLRYNPRKRIASKTSIVQQRGRDHGKGNSRAYYVADQMIDARSQTGTAPDELTAMRYATRASELDHRRLQVPSSPLHDLSPHQLRAGARGERPVVTAVLDRGHQSNRTHRSGPGKAFECQNENPSLAVLCQLRSRGGRAVVPAGTTRPNAAALSCSKPAVGLPP
jgi:hypothetical protein